MVGNHANGEAARHQLVSVAEAYQSVIHESSSVINLDNISLIQYFKIGKMIFILSLLLLNLVLKQ